MTTDLAAALERHHGSEGFCVYCSSGRVYEPGPCDAARAREEIARLRAALDGIKTHAEASSFHRDYRGAMVEVLELARAALTPAPSEP